MAAAIPVQNKKLNVDVDAILATIQVPPVAEADYLGLAAIYVRVSTADQGERYSPVTQLRQLLLKAARDGYRVRREHIFIDTHTGKIANRPSFDNMKALVKRGGVKAVLIYNVDRLARKTVDALTLAGEFKRHGAKLDFVETPYEDSEYGRFTFTQMSAVAELIGEKIVKDSKRGREEAMDEGWLPHTTPCYGYHCFTKREVLNGKSRPRIILVNGERTFAPANERHPQLVLAGDPKMEAVIFDVFRRADRGEQVYRITASLQEAGILTAGGQGPGQGKPGLFHKMAVQRMLRNSTYIGEHRCAGRVFLCDQLIDKDLFYRVQAKMEVTRQKYVGRPQKELRFLLPGFLWCGECTRRWVITEYTRSPAYICGNIDYMTRERHCHAARVNCKLMDGVAWDMIWNEALVPERLLKMAEAFYAAQADPGNAVTRKQERELEKLETGLRNIEQGLKAGVMVFTDDLASEMKAKRSRIASITAELGSARRVGHLPPRHLAQAAVARLRAGKEPSTPAGRRHILEGFEDLKMTYRNGELLIDGRVPMPMESSGSGQKNWNAGQGPCSNSLASIPFSLKRRVA